jgi:peptide-methionine (S)-S-oxide reductase
MLAGKMHVGAKRHPEGETMSEGLETALLGGGCFWCLEAVFEQIDGVEEVVSGYAGGDVPDPTYEQVCSGRTGHAEVVRVRFDPAKVTYRDLLDIFFTMHDPTTPDRQGADVGTQYRSIIFYEDDGQRREAEAAIEAVEASQIWNNRVITQVEPAAHFYPAEAYHQEYYRQNATQPYCRAVIAPKLSKLRKMHLDRLRRDEAARPRERDDQARPFASQPANPLDQGGIAD